MIPLQLISNLFTLFSNINYSGLKVVIALDQISFVMFGKRAVEVIGEMIESPFHTGFVVLVVCLLALAPRYVFDQLWLGVQHTHLLSIWNGLYEQNSM